MPETMMSCLRKGDGEKSSKYENVHKREFRDIALTFNGLKNPMQQFLLLCLNTHQLSQTDILKKWWAHMADIMETNEDLSPQAVALKEVFYHE